MTNEEMFTAIIGRIDSMESNLDGRLDHLGSRMDKLESRLDHLESRMDKLESRLENLESRMDHLESRVDKLESRLDHLESRFDKLEADMDMEFRAVRTEMDVVYKTLKQDIFVLNDKIDRLMYTKDVDGYEKMKIQVELLTKGYQEMKAKTG